MTPLKNDSLCHFSSLKADMGQILKSNFEPDVVKSDLRHEILTLRGFIFQRFLHIFKTLKMSINTLANEVVGCTCFTMVVRLSV